MMTPSSIELRFDPASEAYIRDLWGVASTYYGTDYVLRNGVIPHVALLVSNDDLSGVFHEVPALEMTLRFDRFGFFAGGKIAFLRVVESLDLRDYQRKCFDLASTVGAQIHEYYTPDHWVPHCTVAQQCTSNLEDPLMFSPIHVGVRSLILVEYPPTKVVAERSCA